MKQIRARFVANENKVAAQTRNFLNFPQPNRQNMLKEPMGIPMMPEKVNSRVACFLNEKTGKIIRLRYDIGQNFNFEDDEEYLVSYRFKKIIAVEKMGE